MSVPAEAEDEYAGHRGAWLCAGDFRGAFVATLAGRVPVTCLDDIDEGDILHMPGGRFVEVFLVDRLRERVFCELVEVAA